MPSSDLHQALQAVIHGQIARSAHTWAHEYRLIHLLCTRTRQLRYRGHNRGQILPILIAELAGEAGEESEAPPLPLHLLGEPHTEGAEVRIVVRVEGPVVESEPRQPLGILQRFLAALRLPPAR